MKKNIILPVVIVLLTAAAASAQRVIIGGGFGYPRYGYYPRPRPRPRQQNNYENLPRFEPQVILSFGYGFPNVDKNYLTQFRNYYQGNVSQMGPLTASLDYRFSRTMSIGALVTHGTVNAPYYGSTGNAPAFTGKIDNWSYMLNLMNYIPVSARVTPYLRAAIGVNSWKQDYTDATGNKVIIPDALPDLAYQVGIGAKLNLSQNAGLFVEAGYGKYILHGGLSFSF